MKKSFRSRPNYTLPTVSFASSSNMDVVPAASVSVGGRTNWIFDLDQSVTIYSGPAEKFVRDLVRRTNSTAKPEWKSRAEAFAALQELVLSLPRLPEGHVMSVDEATSERATQLLVDLSQYSVAPPKIFTHGGDAVVLTWDADGLERYVTVVGDELSLLDMHKTSGMKCEEDIDLVAEESRQQWLLKLGGPPLSVSSTANAD